MPECEWTEVDIVSGNVSRPKLLQKGNSLTDILSYGYKEDVVTHITLKSENFARFDLKLKSLSGFKSHSFCFGKEISETFGIQAPVDDENFVYDAIIITKARPPFVLTVVKEKKEEFISHNQALANRVKRGFTYFSTEDLVTICGVLLTTEIEGKYEFEQFMDSCKEKLVETTNEKKLYMDEHKRDAATEALITRMAFQEGENKCLFCLTLEEFKIKYSVTHKVAA